MSSKAKIRTWRTLIFFAPSKSIQGAKIQKIDLLKVKNIIKPMTKMLNPDQEPTNIQQIPNQDMNDMYVLYTYKLRQGTKIQIIGLLKVKKTKSKPWESWKKPNQDFPISYKAPLRTWRTNSIEEAQFGPLVQQK